MRAAMLHSLQLDLVDAPILSNRDALFAYLHASIAHAPAEEMRVLFLSVDNRLLREEAMFHGSVAESPLYAREIMKRALELGATALILAHNHPSGDPTPSSWDVEATRKVVRAGEALDIRVHDHIVVGKGGWSSFRELGLL